MCNQNSQILPQYIKDLVTSWKQDIDEPSHRVHYFTMDKIKADLINSKNNWDLIDENIFMQYMKESGIPEEDREQIYEWLMKSRQYRILRPRSHFVKNFRYRTHPNIQ